jgi:hypothetical protein
MKQTGSFKRFLAIAICMLSLATARSQQLGIYNLSFLPQRSYLNPAFAPHGTFHAGIPVISGIGYSWANNGFRYNDLFRASGSDSTELDIEGVINSLKAENVISTQFETDLLSIGFRMGKNYFSFHGTEKSDIRFGYSRNMMEFLYDGNAATVGTVVHLEPKIEAVHYREHSFQWSRELISWMRAGISVKYLYGMEHVMSKGSGINIHTNPVDYSLTASADYTIYTSGLDTVSFSDFSFSDYAFGKGNNGYAFDLGISANPSRRIELSASVLDLGKITWKSENVIYHTMATGEPFTWSGINLNEFIADDSTSAGEYLSALGDSLYESFGVTTTGKTYHYRMPVKIFGSASYLLTPRYRIILLVRHQSYQTDKQTDYQISFTGKLRTWLNYYVSANRINKSPATLGAGVSMNFNNNQVYFASDNLPGMFSWKKTYVNGFRAGINIVFGTRLKYMSPPQPVVVEPVTENKETVQE